MGSIRLCFLLSCLFSTIISVKKLNNLEDLKNTNYAKSPPRHGLQLLFWFARVVNIDQNNIIRLSQCDPRRGDFGFHCFENRELLLPQNNRESYFSVGNLNYAEATFFPKFVLTNRNTNYPRDNMDRLIVSLDQNNRISRVFITAHNCYRKDFNPDDTYEIDPVLLSQIQQHYLCSFNFDMISQFLQNMGYESNFCRYGRRNKRSEKNDLQCSTCEERKLKIETTSGGYAKVTLEHTPIPLTGSEKAYIDVCQNFYTDNNENNPKRHKQVIKEVKYIKNVVTFENFDTSVLLNAGLQPRLRIYFSSSEEPYIWYGEEFDGSKRILPTAIGWYDASLQLIAKNGYACAQLYIKKSFSDWVTSFANSWVGFYENSHDANDNYYTYQYVVKFALAKSTGDYDIYQYVSSLTISDYVQIRFLKDKGYYSYIASCGPWNNKNNDFSVCEYINREDQKK